MHEIAWEGRTVLFVSHDMTAIQALCQKAILFDEGRLQSESTDVGRIVKDYLGEDPK